MRKLTKDQRYYRKKLKDARRDIRKTTREDGTFGVRVTRRALSVKISTEAFQRLVGMSEEVGIKRWEMLTRMINLGLPGYASLSTSHALTARYEWSTRLLEGYDPDSEYEMELDGRKVKTYEKAKIKYKGTTGDKQITYDITSTAWKTLQCHKTATGLSKARIVQFLILKYKPRTKKQLETEKQKREEYMREREYYESGGRYYKEYKESKLLHCGSGHVIHKKGIPIEYWDEAEMQEYENILLKLEENNKRKLEESEKEQKEFFERNPFMKPQE